MAKTKRHRYFFLGVIVALFTLFVVVEYNAPQPIDWRTTFEKEHKIPFGTYILYDVLPAMFPRSEISTNEISIYSYLRTHSDEDFTYIVINETFNPTELELESLLDHVEAGNSAFISASWFSAGIEEELEFTSDVLFTSTMFTDSVIYTHRFSNARFQNETYSIRGLYYNSYFNRFDTAKTTVLGETYYSDEDFEEINFIKVQYGEGVFFLHTAPLVFTNYNIMESNAIDYTKRAMAYLPDANIVWDEYHKQYRQQTASPLHYILKNPPLKAATFVLLLGLTLFIFFEAKRKQRIIPVIAPPTNTSLEFIETIARLYLHGGDHKDMIEKKFVYLSEYLRSHYFIRIEEFTDEEFRRIAEKTGAERITVSQLLHYYQQLNKSVYVNTSELLQFNKLVEKFYAECA